MYVLLHDFDQLNLAGFAFDIDGPVSLAESHRALPRSLAFQWFGVKPLVLAYVTDPALFNQRNPDSEFAEDFLRYSAKLLVHGSTPGDGRHQCTSYCLQQ